ncbi:uncharacterized protein IUM83_03126 [Phytophthora cinnamomi]|uniref:uncharacterized protein n=1 Tax=Phytophthora cinnamomi TaxID=4785 RepID=UPI00355A1A11|nr:hypothetical protein IUM83_03126 [Phytophthora cinnamomi]
MPPATRSPACRPAEPLTNSSFLAQARPLLPRVIRSCRPVDFNSPSQTATLFMPLVDPLFASSDDIVDPTTIFTGFFYIGACDDPA